MEIGPFLRGALRYKTSFQTAPLWTKNLLLRQAWNRRPCSCLHIESVRRLNLRRFHSFSSTTALFRSARHVDFPRKRCCTFLSCVTMGSRRTVSDIRTPSEKWKGISLAQALPLSHCHCPWVVDFPHSYSTSSESRDDDAVEKVPLAQMHPNVFVSLMKKNGIKRLYVVKDKDSGKLKVSHPVFEELATFLEQDCEYFSDHTGVFMTVGLRTGCLMSVFLWRTSRGQALGGTRLWQYDTLADYLTDGLRLSYSMGTKCALAGLWLGGGKGIIMEPTENKHRDPDFRQKIFYDFGDFVSSLNGCFIAGLGFGTNTCDIQNVRTRSRFTVTAPEDVGGSGDPSVFTGKGVVSAMEAALEFLHMGTLQDKRVAVQGAGNVAVVIIEELLARDVAHLYVTDVHQNRIDDVKDMFASKAGGRLKVQKVPIDDDSILQYPCDILSPCALGSILHKDTVSQVKAKIICGAANNQLSTEEDNQLLVDRGITFVVDFLANRMGVVTCSTEHHGRLPEDPLISRHLEKEWEDSVFQMTKKILQKATDEAVTPQAAAVCYADQLSLQVHPLYPHRTQQIIDALVEYGWHEGLDYWK